MSLRPKTARRLLLLGIAAVLLAGGAFGLVFVRRWQNQRMDARHRSEGIAAAGDGRYVDALTNLSRYLRRHQRDAEAILTYARVRVEIEDRDGGHLRDAIDKYERLLDLTPDDRAARLELLDLYLRVGYWKEASECAQRLRPSELAACGETDVPVMVKEAAGLLGALDFGPRVSGLLARALELEPLDVHAHLAFLDLLAGTDRRNDGVAHAESLLGAHPDDARAQLVMAYAILMHEGGDGHARAASLLAQAVGLDPETGDRVRDPLTSDADLAGRIALGLDLAGRPDLAIASLAHDAGRLGDPMLERLAVRRLWQAGRVREAADAASAFETDEALADTDLLGLRALALNVLNEPDEAGRLAGVLDARPHDYRAAPWASVIRLTDPRSSIAPGERIAVLASASKAYPLEPIFSSMQASELAALGRREEAWESWRSAIRSPLAAAWAGPRAALGESLLGAGRISDAFEAISDARRVAPQAVFVNVAWIEALSAMLAQGLSAGVGAADALPLAEALDADLASRAADDSVRGFRERLLASRVELSILAGRTDAAAALIRASLDGSAPLGVQTLQRLERASEAGRLGLSAEINARLASTHGQLPSVALAGALDLAGEEGVERGLEHLRGAARSGGDSTEWTLAVARYLEITRHHDAASAWVALADAHPDDLTIQRMALEAESIASDRAFVDRTIARYKGLIAKTTGIEPVVVRLARARALLSSTGARERAEAISSLQVIVSEEPGSIEPRLLLARVLAHADPARGIQPDLPRAIEQYEELRARAPGRPTISLELARLYQAQRDFPRARSVLEDVLNDPGVEEGVRLSAAGALVRQGDAAVAVLAMESIVDARADEVDSSVLLALAQGYLSLRRDVDAAAVFDRLAARELSEPVMVFAVAQSVASRGRYDEGVALVRRLDPTLAGVGVVETLEARLCQEFRSLDEAIAAYERAVAAAPKRFEAWRGYVDLMLREGRTDDANAIARRAHAALGDSPDVAMMIAQTSATGGIEDLGSVLAILERDSTNADAQRLAGALRAARDAGELDSPPGLAALADREPNSYPVQVFAARRLQELGDDARALAVSVRAMSVFPSRPDPARLASISALRVRDFATMLKAAEAWRAREFPRSKEADLAVAEALVGLAQHERALQELDALIPAASATPDESIHLGVLNIAAQAMLALGRDEACRNLLTPLLPRSAGVRVSVWIPLAGRSMRTRDDAVAWLASTESHIAAASDERLVLANAYVGLVALYPAQAGDLLARAGRVIDAFLAALDAEARADASVSRAIALEMRGVIRHQTGDLAGAEGDYRAAIAGDAGRADALNNLAYILLDRPDALGEAVDLARRAVASRTPASPAHLDTLGQALRRLGDAKDLAGDASAIDAYREAASAFRSIIASSPSDTAAWAQFAILSELIGDWNQAVAAYDAILAAPGVTGEAGAGVANNLAYALVRPERSPTQAEIERARSLARGALSTSERAAFWDTLGEVELASGRLDEAEKAFKRAIEMEPKGVSARLGLGETYLRQGGASLPAAAQILDEIGVLTKDVKEPISPGLARRIARFRELVGSAR